MTITWMSGSRARTPGSTAHPSRPSPRLPSRGTPDSPDSRDSPDSPDSRRADAGAWRATSASGVALLMALLVTLFVSAVGGALVLLASTETRIAGGEECRHEARGVAEVLLERVFQDVLLAPDWTAVLSAGAGASLRDTTGPARAVSWGLLDLAALSLNVQRDADDSNRWGSEGPQWRLYAFGPADALFASSAGTGGGSGGTSGGGVQDRASAFYVIAWVADDPGEGDSDPGADRNETIQVRAEAFGPMRTRQAVLATVRRKSGMLELLSWRAPEPP
jgi:hypothetical protein